MNVNITPDLSRVPNLAARREAEQLYSAENAAAAASSAADEAAIANSPEAVAAQKVCDAASEAYRDHPLMLLHDYSRDDDIARCALSGLPLVDGDDVLECSETGKRVLRCLVLAPIPTEPDEDEAAQEAAQADEVAA